MIWKVEKWVDWFSKMFFHFSNFFMEKNRLQRKLFLQKKIKKDVGYLLIKISISWRTSHHITQFILTSHKNKLFLLLFFILLLNGA